jgi:hypothetical protein
MFCADQLEAEVITLLTCSGDSAAHTTRAPIRLTDIQKTALGRLRSFSASITVTDRVWNLSSV